MRNRLKNIEHPGIIETTADNSVIVRIKPQSACASCQSKSHCGIADNTDKIVEVQISGNKEYKIGEEVIITLEKNLGYKALLMGYMIPFMILLVSLILMLAITKNEGISAITALLLMAPYYFLLYRYRHKMRKTFNFKLK